MRLFLVLAAVSLVGQQAPPRPGRITGKAVNAVTNEVVRKASIHLQSPALGGEGIATTTDSEGRFAFEDLVPDNYRVFGEKAGFLRSYYGARSVESAGRTIGIRPDALAQDVVVKLIPAAVISGRVLDEDGEAVEGALVTPLLHESFEGSKQWLQKSAGANTNERGEFRISGIAPGPLRIAVQLGRSAPTNPKNAAGQELIYPRTYFPGVDRINEAQSLHPQAGQELGGLQIPLKRILVYRIRGRYAASLGEAGPGQVQIQIRETNGFSPFDTSGDTSKGLNPKDGSFEVSKLRPGSYTLSVVEHSEKGPRFLGSTDVQLGAEDIEGVVIEPQAPLHIVGRLSLEEDPHARREAPALDLKSFQVQFVPADLSMIQFSAPIPVADDGTFQLAGVTPDRFHVNVQGPFGRTYVKSMSNGGREIPDHVVDLGRGSAHIEVVVSSKLGRLSGVVEKADPSVASGSVLLQRVGGAIGATGQALTFEVSQNGQFNANSIAPGKYLAYAFEEIDSNQAWNEDFLKKFASKATEIKIGEGETKTVSLKQIPFSEVETATKEQ